MPKTYDPIATTTLGSAASSYTFSSIPSTYTDLILVYSGIVDSSSQYFQVQLNGDTASNYSYTILSYDGSSASSFRQSSDGLLFGVTTSSTLQQGEIMHFMNYSNTTTYKTTLSRFSSTAYQVWTHAGLWRNTAAINSIKLYTTAGANFKTGTTFTLYGIKAA